MSTLYNLTGEYMELLEMLQDGETDEQIINDTLEGISGEIELKADNYAKIIKELEGKAETIKKEVDRLNNKRKTIENNIKSLKSSLENSMKATGKTKFKTDLFSFRIQKNAPRLVINGEVPEEFLIPQEPKPDNARIKELLNEKELDFAHLESSESIRIG